MPSPPEVREPKETGEQVPVSALLEVVTEEKAESEEHQESREDSPAAPVGQEEIEEVGGAPRMRKCRHVSRKIGKR